MNIKLRDNKPGMQINTNTDNFSTCSSALTKVGFSTSRNAVVSQFAQFNEFQKTLC